MDQPVAKTGHAGRFAEVTDFDWLREILTQQLAHCLLRVSVQEI